MTPSSIALSNLRAVVILVVVAFHSVLAYVASASRPPRRFDEPPYLWQAFPISDNQHWIGFDLFCAWQDVSLMSLMFFLSGLFVCPSLVRKGSGTYCLERLRRLGIPFGLAVLFLSPISYFASYRATALSPSVEGFWKIWISLPFWPSGPQWFLAELLLFNLLAVAAFAVAPGCIQRFIRFGAWVSNRPLYSFFTLVAISALAYVPLSVIYSPWAWWQFGPLSAQLSRPLHYLVYFSAGLAIGSYGLDRGLLAAAGPLARNWAAWLAAAVLSFFIWAGFTSLTLPDWYQARLTTQLAASISFVLACASGCVFLLAGCLRFGRERRRMLDSLSANAYEIYLVHYPFVVWLQYALLGWDQPAMVKAMTVFGGALPASWATAAGLMRLVGPRWQRGRPSSRV